MNYILQWVIVAVVVAAATIFLVRRLSPKQNGGCCDGNCSGCSKQSVVKNCNEGKNR